MIRDTLKFDVGQTPPPHTTLCIAFMHVLLVFDAIIFIPNVLGKTSAWARASCSSPAPTARSSSVHWTP